MQLRKPKSIPEKREQEKQTIRFMIELYSKKVDHEPMSQECQDLYDYACKRIDHCPFMETKTFCSTCKVHCYGKQQREKIKEVMRFSGPRMLFYHPVMAIKHVLNTLKSKLEDKKSAKAK